MNDSYIKLIGDWKVVSSNYLPFDHPSFCEELELGSVFNFDKYGFVEIFISENSKTNCNKTQSYWIDSTRIIIFEYDVGFEYDILKLTNDSLVMESEWLQKSNIERLTTEKIMKIDTLDINSDSAIKLKIELIKINNGG